VCVLDAELGDLVTAEAECNAALALAPSIPTVYVNLADVQRAAGKEEASRATLRAGIAIAPGNAALWHALGLALVRSHEPAQALVALEKATTLDPANSRFAQVYRIALAELGPRGAAR
jgi:Flp pilus assembly protein TadD